MPIIAASFCPHPPLLMPRVAVGARGELDDLRAACGDSVRTMLADVPEEVIVIGGADRSQLFDTPSDGRLTGYGIDWDVFNAPFGEGSSFTFDPDTPLLPLSLTIGAWLLRRPPREERSANTGDTSGWSGPVRGVAVGPDGPPPLLIDDSRRTALLVMGDGSPSRSVKAPGYLDSRAEPFDASVVAALASGDVARLAALDWVLGAELGAAGGPAWRLAATLLGAGPWGSTLRYDGAPYGVGYFVADWRLAR